MSSINVDIPVTATSDEWAATTADALERAKTSTLEEAQPEARGTAQFKEQAAVASVSTPDVPGAYPGESNEPKAALDRLANTTTEGTPYAMASDAAETAKQYLPSSTGEAVETVKQYLPNSTGEAVETVKQYLPGKEDVQRAVNAVGEAAEKMAAQMGMPVDVTEPNEVDKKLGETPDISTTTANASSAIGSTANTAVAGIAGTFGGAGAQANRPEAAPIPGSALPSQSVMSAVNMDTPKLETSAGQDYIDIATTIDATTAHPPTDRPEAVSIPSSALPSQSVMDAVRMDTPKTEAQPRDLAAAGATTGVGAGGALAPSLSSAANDFPLPKSDPQVDAGAGKKDDDAVALKPGTREDKDQPGLNTAPPTTNKHVTEGSGVQVPESVPATGTSGSLGSEAESRSGKSESAPEKGEKKTGKAHNFMSKVKDKLHMH